MMQTEIPSHVATTPTVTGCGVALKNDIVNATALNCNSCTGASTTPCGHASVIHSKEDYIGIFDILKIGVGPSSSHTVGPMWAGKRFVEQLCDEKLVDFVERAQVHLYGSLALTGKGHSTDKASVLGLAGYQPDTIDPDLADDTFTNVVQSKLLLLNGVKKVKFNFDEDVIFHMDEELPLHPNGMVIIIHDEQQNIIKQQTYYSIGGGFIKTEKELVEAREGSSGKSTPVESSGTKQSIDRASSATTADSVTPSSDLSPASQSTASGSVSEVAVPFFFSTATELVELCKVNNMTIADLMIQNECAFRQLTVNEVYQKLDHIADVMDGCVERGLRVEGRMPVSNIPRRSAQIKRRLSQNIEHYLNDPLAVSDWIALYARAVNEENACGGRVVTSPTNGAAGTVPAVLTYYRRSVPTASKQGVRDFLATAAAIGSLCKRNASISGAEAGCQAEVGSACAMAAAALASVLGGSLGQIENAAEIGLEHCLGMTCDPVMGLVQIPCIERNCVAAIKAVMGCRLALVGDGDHEVSLDSCIETMYRTGLDMQSKYRETSQGGLAVFAKKPPHF